MFKFFWLFNNRLKNFKLRANFSLFVIYFLLFFSLDSYRKWVCPEKYRQQQQQNRRVHHHRQSRRSKKSQKNGRATGGGGRGTMKSMISKTPITEVSAVPSSSDGSSSSFGGMSASAQSPTSRGETGGIFVIKKRI